MSEYTRAPRSGCGRGAGEWCPRPPEREISKRAKILKIQRDIIMILFPILFSTLIYSNRKGKKKKLNKINTLYLLVPRRNKTGVISSYAPGGRNIQLSYGHGITHLIIMYTRFIMYMMVVIDELIFVFTLDCRESDKIVCHRNCRVSLCLLKNL